MEDRDGAQFRSPPKELVTMPARQRGAVGWLFALLAALALMLGGTSTALAHGKKKHGAETEQVQPQAAPGGAAPATGTDGHSAQQQMGNMMDDMDMDMDRSKLSFLQRLVGWFGRLHPAIVHFPIAFFTAAWFTAVVGRRRPAFAAPVQFLVVAGGILAPIAAIAGWLTAADADPSSTLTYHRWLGTGVGIVGLLLAIWAWKRPWEDRGAGMIAALTAMSLAVLVQAGLGAVITHGAEHLMF